MKFKNKGRKLYKTKEKKYYGKSPADKLLSACLTLLLVGGIGIIGYSAAGPILNFTRKQGDDNSADLPFRIDDTDFHGGDGSTTEDSFLPTQAPTEAPSEEAEPSEQHSAEQYSAAALSVNDLMTIESLNNALAAIPTEQNITYVEIPLKIRGGAIYYNSTNEEAWRSGAVKSTIMLPELAETIRSAGYRPAAIISTFNDNIMPASYPAAGYVTADGMDQWIDDNAEAGGKPWLSPYSESALTYLTYLTGEAVEAGFDCIVCSDFSFPEFRDTDLALLDERLQRKDRYLSMTSAANMLYTKCTEGESRMFLEVSAADLLRGTNDMLQPMLLSTGTVVLNINVDELSTVLTDGRTVYEFEGTPADMTDKVLGFLEDRFKDFNTVVRISGSTLSTEELLKAKDVITEHGFSSYVIG